MRSMTLCLRGGLWMLAWRVFRFIRTVRVRSASYCVHVAGMVVQLSFFTFGRCELYGEQGRNSWCAQKLFRQRNYVRATVRCAAKVRLEVKIQWFLSLTCMHRIDRHEQTYHSRPATSGVYYVLV